MVPQLGANRAEVEQRAGRVVRGCRERVLDVQRLEERRESVRVPVAVPVVATQVVERCGAQLGARVLVLGKESVTPSEHLGLVEEIAGLRARRVQDYDRTKIYTRLPRRQQRMTPLACRLDAPMWEEAYDRAGVERRSEKEDVIYVYKLRFTCEYLDCSRSCMAVVLQSMARRSQQGTAQSSLSSETNCAEIQTHL